MLAIRPQPLRITTHHPIRPRPLAFGSVLPPPLPHVVAATARPAPVAASPSPFGAIPQAERSEDALVVSDADIVEVAQSESRVRSPLWSVRSATPPETPRWAPSTIDETELACPHCAGIPRRRTLAPWAAIVVAVGIAAGLYFDKPARPRAMRDVRSFVHAVAPAAPVPHAAAHHVKY